LFFENLQRCSREFGAPDTIVVGLGPGSYAGVRIAIATAVGLRAASVTKLIGIASVCGMDTAARAFCVIGDARRASFFFGRVSDGRLTEGPSLHSRVELEMKIEESNVPLYASEPLPQFPGAALVYPSARRLAEVARHQAGEIADSQSLEPIYLRAPHITVPKASRASAIDQ
jgi:tRNA threonylcarbamoyladenosine biosynthesis protein TsaB